MGNSVSNQGVITAQLGTVALGAGNAVTLTFNGNNLVKMQVDQSILNSLAENKQLIRADGGMVIMTAGAKNTLLASVVNNTGVIEARTVENHDGTIILLGGMEAGQVNVGGTLDASAPNGGNGGFIETSAAHVTVANDTKITTAAPQGHSGTWLIDPVDFTIAASGGDMTGAALGNLLGSNSVTIQTAIGTNTATNLYGTTGTNGNINVNDVVSWSVNKLTLNAFNNININTAMNGSGTAQLALEYGQGAGAAGNTSTYNVNAPVNLAAGNNFSTKLGSDGVVKNYTVLTSLGAAGSASGTDLQGMNGNQAGNYVLGANIDATATSLWNSGEGFAPVGNSATGFTGTFDGLGHIISNLTINRTWTSNVGLFGNADLHSAIRNVGLVGGSASGDYYVGGLVGFNNGGTVSNSYATGSVTGRTYTGGLVGYNGNGTVSNSYATGSVTGEGISTGGLVGHNESGTVSNSYATGSVTGRNYTGGLVGFNGSSTVSNSYATGSVSGVNGVGGLVGHNYGGTVSNSYATGSVTGEGTSTGGLVGHNESGTVSNSYWNSDVKATGIGGGTTTGATGLTAVQMQTASSFVGFTFTTTPGASGNNWVMVDADGTLNNAGSAAGATLPILASEYSTTINNAHQLQLMAMAFSASYTLGANIDALSTGNSKDVWGSSGFVPVGNAAAYFTGTFDGLNHTISNLSINRPTYNGVGLFGYSFRDTVIRNVGLVGVSVIGRSHVGGLVGDLIEGTVSNSYATGNVSGNSEIGGIVGNSRYGTIINSYATSSISGSSNNVGGLLGLNFEGTVSNSYATGNVTGISYTGGLVGFSNTGTVSNSYATGSVTGGDSTGGLVGHNLTSTVSNSYWNTTTSGQATSAGGTGLTTTQMQQQSNFSSWDFTNTWIGYDGFTNPLLRSFMTPLTVTANNATKTYDGLAYSGGNGVTYSVTPNMSNMLGTLSYTGGTNVGSYAITPSGLYSNQQGYIISYSNGALTVNPKTVNLTGSRVYDGTANAAAGALTLGGLVGTETLSLTGAGTLADKNVGTAKAVTLGTLALGDGTGLASNYTFTGGTKSLDVTAKALTVGSTAANKVYDGTTTGTVTLADNRVAGDVLNLSNAAANFTDKNAGSGKTVNVSGIHVAGTDAGNYTFNTTAATTADITAKALTVSATGSNKVYDGTTSRHRDLGGQPRDRRRAEFEQRRGELHRQERRHRQDRERQRHPCRGHGCRQLHLQHRRHHHGRHPDEGPDRQRHRQQQGV